MTDITVKLDPETGAATIELRGAAVAEPKFRLRDTATEKFLTKRGWSKTPSYLPGEAVTAADFTVLLLDAELARRINAGTNLVLEQPTSNIFANLAWPAAAAAEEEADQAQADDDLSAMEGAALADLATSGPDRTDDVNAADMAEGIKPAADDEAPTSLEPSIRDESNASYRAEAPFVAVEPPKKAPIEDEDDDEDDRGTPWGKLAAAAVLFMLLGAILTYFWQSSAYDQELRTAMRAVEAQRDQIKADLESRLSAAQSNGSNTVTAANAQVATLTGQTDDLTRERDEARTALTEQQAAVKTLEERLATAQGEIDGLKASSEANASEQSAVFNDRIEALGKQLDTARTELQKSRTELGARDQAIAKSGEDLKKANAEIAALKNANEEQSTVANDELQGRIGELSAQLDKSAQDLAGRDATLRDVQSKLSVANVQIEALKQVAGKATEADLERGTLADRITELADQIDKADKDLAAKDDELRKAKTSLETANSLLATNTEELDRLKSGASTTTAGTNSASASAEVTRLREERDLFAKELTSMTESFNTLKAERDRLAGGGVEQQSASLNSSTPSEARAIWGATAIDQTGAVYSLQNQTAEQSASDNVVALCRGKSNGRCEALRSYSNSCFSLARIEGEGPRNDNFGFAVGKTWQAAEASAMRQCEELGTNCTVRFTACSPDRLSKQAVNQ